VAASFSGGPTGRSVQDRHGTFGRPNSRSPVKPSRCSGHAHTRHQRSPRGLNQRPVQDGDSRQCVACSWVAVRHPPAPVRLGDETRARVAGFWHRSHGATVDGGAATEGGPPRSTSLVSRGRRVGISFPHAASDPDRQLLMIRATCLDALCPRPNPTCGGVGPATSTPRTWWLWDGDIPTT
jgi:hypothetical protein